ncbi:GAP family protein [Agromyces soli]
MDWIASAPLGASLAMLALLDGLSIGTLLIPVFLLLAPRLRGGRVLLYLGTIAGFYLLVGALFMLGLVNLVDVAREFLGSTAGMVARLVVGVLLLIVAIAMPTKQKARSTVGVVAASGAVGTDSAPSATQVPAPAPGGRIAHWRDRLLSERSSPATVMAVALGAGVVEVATMLPYLVAMGLLSEADLSMPLRYAALAGYCLLMIVPALLLLALRLLAAPLVQRPLERLASWLERTTAENTAWIVGIVGFLIARSAAAELGVFDAIPALTGR